MNETKVPKVGDKIKTWFSGEPGGYSTIVKVSQYRGKYTESFNWDITVTAPKVKSRYNSGLLEMSISPYDLE